MKYKRRILSVLMILCLLLGCTSVSAFAASGKSIRVSGTQNYADAQEVLRLINKKRAGKGLSKLKLDKSLTKSAVRRAEELMIYIPESSPHRRPNGKLTKSINKKIMYECCAEGYTTPKDVVAGWWSSPPHKKGILLKNARSVGIGCVTSENGEMYWTLEFSSSKARKAEKRRNTVAVSCKVSALSKYLKKSNFFLAQKGDFGDLEWSTFYAGQTASICPMFRNNYYYFTELKASDYTWSSGDESVAVVDSSGTVTCLKPGKAVITAKMKGSPGYTLKGTLEVQENEFDDPYYEDDFDYDDYYDDF